MNIALWTVAIAVLGAPDVTITLLPAQVDGSEVTLSVKVANQGSEPSAAFNIDLYHNSIAAPGAGQPGDYTFAAPALPVLGSYLGQYTFGPLPKGAFQAWAWADRSNSIGDSDTSNNLAGPAAYQYPPALGGDKPDLVIKSLITQQAYGELRYIVTVANQGSQPASDVDVHMFYDSAANPDCWNHDFTASPYEQTLLEELAAGDSVELTFVWPWPPDGQHTSWLKLDCYDVVGESNDNNNDAGPIAAAFDADVMGVDLRVSNLSATVDCDTVAYIVDVTNDGDVDAPPFRVDVFYDAVEPPAFGKEGDFGKLVEDGLKAGDTVSVPHFRLDTPGAAYTSWAVVDAIQSVTETRYINGPNVAEDNNHAKVEVEVGAITCACADAEEIKGPCDCGPVVAESGWCCKGVWSLDACEPPPQDPPQAGDDNPSGDPPPAGEDPTGTGGGGPFGAPEGAWDNMAGQGGGGAPPIPSDTVQMNNGCTRAPGPTDIPGHMLALAMFLALAAYTARE